MDIIINELSLRGFADISDFANKTAKYTLPIFKIVEKVNYYRLYEIHILKISNLFSIMVTSTDSLQQIINQRNRLTGIEAEIFRKLKSYLVKYTMSEPFWNINPHHDCTAIYKSSVTTKTCNYSIAEAYERDYKIISFYNPIFSSIEFIPVMKNATDQINVCNIFDTNMFMDCIFGKETHRINDYPLNWAINVNRNPNSNLFPLENNINEIIELDKYFKLRIQLSPENRIPIDKRFSKIVATINYWKYDNSISSKNSGRTIYCAGSGRQKLYISIDTENGRFELFNKRGIHKGEYDYYGNKTKEAKARRKINV